MVVQLGRGTYVLPLVVYGTRMRQVKHLKYSTAAGVGALLDGGRAGGWANLCKVRPVFWRAPERHTI